MSGSSTATQGEMNQKPRRCIFNDVDMKHFMTSSTKKELLNFIEAMGKACSSGGNETTGAAFDPSQPLKNLTLSMACLHGSLQEMVRWVDDFPPTVEAVRFGNPSFRLWHQRLLERSEAIITVILQARDSDNSVTVEAACQKGRDAATGLIHPQGDESIQQVSCYLHDSFGHATRLDYGTGHESSFFVFLLVLSKVKCMGDSPSLETLRAITLSIVNQYLTVTRRLQTVYRLEPAGSHGVWGLDDYHCIPFYLGACQLQSKGVHPIELLDPKCPNDDYILKDYGDGYLYLGCIRYIRNLKQGVPFFESSPMLYDISQTLPSWDKVARGLLRLYQGEVLDKRQVVQHFVFSKLFPCTWTPSRLSEAVAPTETFRTVGDTTGSVGNNTTIPTTRAPWATSGSSAVTTEPTIMTKAPWAIGNDATVDAMAPTRAPWASDKPSEK
ncbi:phosphotyrosyl phosphate activator PTPA domain containing protein [Nitzschia inconspicua]|uniref:Serine/threonine-protein phosphatase 2A activator n=1 Tax=Nitzschia inconspicua TaxID=303405 RepID=A0A9K3KY30_9STRA|nr:phosphotyrosyl phosphate activator PTPA domain containing protein [Nitzschia inconspicua]